MSEKEVTAPLSGAVISINVDVGASVEEDEELFVMEAMKVETSVFSPCDGTVKELWVNKGDRVDEDDVLAVLDKK